MFTRGKIILIGIILLFMAACGPAPSNEQVLNASGATATGIIGGKEVATNEAPAQVSVAIYNTLKQSICSGVLIGNNLVLTAAHCLGPDPRKLVILFTQHVQKSIQDMARAVIGAIAHPNWKPNLQRTTDHADLAIIKYYGTTPTGYRAVTVLPNTSVTTVIRNNSLIVLVGYGASDDLKKSGSGPLRQVMTTITNSQFSQTEVQVEQRQGRGACLGDSGGPAFVVANGVYYLWGILSRGAGPKDQCNTFSIYTNIFAYVPWLQTTARSLAVTNQFSYPQ